MFQWLQPKKDLGDRDVEHGLRMLLFEAVFSQISLILGMGPFVVAFALLLGASNKTIGLVAAVGPLAQILQIPAIYLVERMRLRKVLTVIASSVSRVALFAIAALPWLAPPGFRIPFFLLCLSVYFGSGAVSACAFNSWFRDFVPPERMSAFLARRLTWATFFGAVVSFLGGVGVDFQKAHSTSPEAGYSCVFALAGLTGLAAVLFAGRTPEPTMPETDQASLMSLLAQPFKDANFRRLLVFLGWWSFAVNFAAPFFAVYLIGRLGLSMTAVLSLSVLSQLANVLFFSLWGRLADQFSNRSVLAFSVPVFFLTFLLWPFTTLPDRHLLTIPLLAGIHIVAGISVAGVTLCAGNLALKSAPYGKAASYLAVNALVSGAAATIAPVIAGFAADWFAPYEIRFTLSCLQWEAGLTEFELPTLDLRGLDFIFVAGFVFGTYSFHRLLAIKEEGTVDEQVLRQAFFGEMRRVVRQVSTVAGMRQVASFPFAYLAGIRGRK